MPKSLTVWITTNCGKFLKRWEYQTTLPASWETRHGTADWLQIGKGVRQGCMLSPCLFNLYAGPIKYKLESRLSGEMSIISDMQMSLPSRQKLKVKSLSCVQLLVTLWTVAYQAPPSMGFYRQEYWSGLPFPSPGDLPDPGTEPGSPALQADTLKPLSHQASPKSLLMKVKEESEKAGLKLTIQKTKIMASGPITSWQTDRETMETVTDYFLGLQNHSRW